MAPPLKRLDFFNLVNSGKTINDINVSCKKCIDFMTNHHGKDTIPDDLHKRTVSVIRAFLYKLKVRWNQNYRVEKTFLCKNKEWLNGVITFPDEVMQFLSEDTTPSSSTAPSTSQELINLKGRPQKDWQSLSERSRKRHAHDMLTENAPDKILYAASQGAFKKNPDLKHITEVYERF